MVNWSTLDTVFLDMDGTLLDLHFDNHFWLEHLPLRYAQKNNLQPQVAKQQLMALLMAQSGSLNWYCTDYWSDQLAMDINALKAEVGERVSYRPHVRAFLSSLRERGVYTVIATNCHPDPLAMKLERTGLDTLVDGIVSSHQLGKPKENPDFWQLLNRVIPYNRSRTLMVDDSFAVLESAAKAGIAQLLAVLAPDSQRPANSAHPQITGIHDFDEVLPQLQKQRALTSIG